MNETAVQLADGDTISITDYGEDARRRIAEGNPQPTTLAELKTVYRKHLEIGPEDDDIIDVTLSVACERRIPGDPVWLFLVGASGCIKTELLRSLSDIPETYTLDSITPNTLISGKVEKNEEGEYEPIAGILKHLNERVLIIKDFTTILSMREEQRQQILGDFRSSYDGYLEKAYGTLEQPIRVKATYGLLAAVTPAIDKYVKTAVTLGERFLKIRTHSDKRLQIARKALGNMGHESAMREQLKNAAANYIKTLDFSTPTTTTKHYEEAILHMALYVAAMRAHVWTNFYRGDIVYMDVPEIEFPTRITKQLSKLGKLLCIIRQRTEYGEEEHATLTRIAKDSGLPERQQIIDYLIKQPRNHQASTKELTDDLGINWNTTKANLEIMTALGIIKASGDAIITQTDYGERYTQLEQRWSINPDFRQTIDKAYLYDVVPQQSTFN